MDEYTKDLYTMMFSLQTLQNQGITIRETVYKSLDKLLLWNKESENSKYLELALLHMQAYANMGFALDEENKTICEILKKTGKTREDFFPKGYLLGKRIKLTRSQVRGMIGRWRPSRDSPMTIGELVDDIINGDRIKYILHVCSSLCHGSVQRFVAFFQFGNTCTCSFGLFFLSFFHQLTDRAGK